LAKSFGAWAFLIGVILALIIGLVSKGSITGLWAGILAVVGLIVGLLNVADKEVTPFMMAGIVLILASSFGGQVVQDIPGLGGYLSGVLDSILILFTPATIIVALKSVFALAKD